MRLIGNFFFFITAMILSFSVYAESVNARNTELEYMRNLSSQEGALKNFDRSNVSPGVRGRASLMQGYATSLSWVGDLQGALMIFDELSLLQGPKPSPVVDVSDASPEDAIAAILKAAENRQIVILNEAHHMPMHRAFAMRLARELRKLGFEYLACETFSNTENLLSTGYARRTDGYYLREPFFAEFARDAALDGWKPIGYEPRPIKASREEQMRRRELDQAKNIYDKIWALQPNAKAFIYVGYSHGNKSPVLLGDLENFLFMGGHLKKLTGFDPLVIDQVEMVNHVIPAAENPTYRATIKSHPSTLPFVLRDKTGVPILFNSNQRQIDLQIIWPATQFTNGWLTWITTIAERKTVDLPVDLIPKVGKRLIYAFHSEDGVDALPVATIVIDAKVISPKIMLPKGTFRFSFEDIAQPIDAN